MAVTFGVLAALFWGITDFLAGPSARRVGVERVVFFTNALGLLALGILFLVRPAFYTHLWQAHPRDILLALLSVILLLLATIALAQALKTGKSAVVAPVAMSYGVVTTLLSWYSGAHLGLLHTIGILACLTGVPMTAMAPDASNSTATSDKVAGADKQGLFPALVYALIAALCFGTSYWLQGQFAIPALGTAGFLAINYLFSFVALGGTLIITQKMTGNGAAVKTVAETGLDQVRRYPIVIGQALTSLMALGCFTAGMSTGSTATVAVLGSMSGAATAILGLMFRGEKLSRVQWAGLCIVLSGTAAVRG